jgi:hypothetical protein
MIAEPVEWPWAGKRVPLPTGSMVVIGGASRVHTAFRSCRRHESDWPAVERSDTAGKKNKHAASRRDASNSLDKLSEARMVHAGIPSGCSPFGAGCIHGKDCAPEGTVKKRWCRVSDIFECTAH